MFKRTLIVVAAIGVLAGATGCAVPPGTFTLALVCKELDATATFSPAITDTPGEVTMTIDEATVGKCLDAWGQPVYRGVLKDFSATFPAIGCRTYGDSATGTGLIEWNDGSSTTVAFTVQQDTYREHMFHLLLDATSGRYAGVPGGATLSPGDVDGDCASGITGQTFVRTDQALGFYW